MVVKTFNQLISAKVIVVACLAKMMMMMMMIQHTHNYDDDSNVTRLLEPRRDKDTGICTLLSTFLHTM